MSSRRSRPSLLDGRFQKLFSPIQVNQDMLKQGKILSLYRFSSSFLPTLSVDILKILMDMEKHSHRLTSGISPREREILIRELDGITVEMRYTVKDKGEEIMVVPINISPKEVLKQAALDKRHLRYTRKMQREINKIIFSFVIKEIRHKTKETIEKFLKVLLIKPKIPVLVKELLTKRLINRKGHLARGTTIEDMISGKYAKLFRTALPAQLVSEALLIGQTIRASYDWQDKDYQTLANAALANKGVLEITLGEMEKRKRK